MLENIFKYFDFFFNGGDYIFSTEFEILLYRAADIWTEMQHNKKIVKMNIEDGNFPE
jgi:hypothetical protein